MLSHFSKNYVCDVDKGTENLAIGKCDISPAARDKKEGSEFCNHDFTQDDYHRKKEPPPSSSLAVQESTTIFSRQIHNNVKTEEASAVLSTIADASSTLFVPDSTTSSILKTKSSVEKGDKNAATTSPSNQRELEGAVWI